MPQDWQGFYESPLSTNGPPNPPCSLVIAAPGLGFWQRGITGLALNCRCNRCVQPSAWEAPVARPTEDGCLLVGSAECVSEPSSCRTANWLPDPCPARTNAQYAGRGGFHPVASQRNQFSEAPRPGPKRHLDEPAAPAAERCEMAGAHEWHRHRAVGQRSGQLLRHDRALMPMPTTPPPTQDWRPRRVCPARRIYGAASPRMSACAKPVSWRARRWSTSSDCNMPSSTVPAA